MKKIFTILIMATLLAITACNSGNETTSAPRTTPRNADSIPSASDLMDVLEDAGIDVFAQNTEPVAVLPSDFHNELGLERLLGFQTMSGNFTLQDLIDIYGGYTAHRVNIPEGLLDNHSFYRFSGEDVTWMSITAYVPYEQINNPYSERLVTELRVMPKWGALINSPAVNIESLEGNRNDYEVEGMTYNDFKEIGGSDGTIISFFNGVPYYRLWFDGYNNIIAVFDENGNALDAYSYHHIRRGEESWDSQFQFYSRPLVGYGNTP
jgi:hypothetical protein